MDNSAELQTFKIVIIGDSYTGKTSLAYRLCTGKFYEKLETTIGVDFFQKIVNINDERVKIQVWDSAGQERFRKSMTVHYYRNVDAIVFVYDITSKPSFQSLTLWVEEYKHYTIPDKVVKLLIGTKSDLTESKRVETNVARKFAEQYGMPFYEVSSKNDGDKQTIETIFSSVAEKLHKEKPVVLKRARVLSKSGSLHSRGSEKSATLEKNVTLKDEKEKLEKEKKKCCGSGS